MAVTITPTPASGSITATKDVVTFDITGATANNASAFDANAYPTQPEYRYVLTFVENSIEYGRSQVMGASPTGATLQFNGYVFPHDGTWTVQLYDVTGGTFAAVSTFATVVVAA